MQKIDKIQIMQQKITKYKLKCELKWCSFSIWYFEIIYNQYESTINHNNQQWRSGIWCKQMFALILT